MTVAIATFVTFDQAAHYAKTWAMNRRAVAIVTRIPTGWQVMHRATKYPMAYDWGDSSWRYEPEPDGAQETWAAWDGIEFSENLARSEDEGWFYG